MVMIFGVLAGTCTASAVRADAVSDALNAAIAVFDQAQPALARETMGVETAAYGLALRTGQFLSPYWGRALALDLHQNQDSGGACARFAAYVSLPPSDDTIRLTLCPQFSAEGTPELRRLTILHEMVHVVAGPDECRAMAFAARLEQLGTGAFTPVDRYWQANDCEASGFDLP